MRTRLISGIVLSALVLACASCGSSKPAPEVTARRQATTFLRLTKTGPINDICDLFTRPLLVRLAPPDGGCVRAMATLTRYTGAEAEDTLAKKRVSSVKVTGDAATVTLTDKFTGENPLPLRLVKHGDTWLIDDVGAGAQIAEACVDEKAAVMAAVDKYLSDNAEYPKDAKALVPSYLPKLPDNHVVGADGKVTPKGICA